MTSFTPKELKELRKAMQECLDKAMKLEDTVFGMSVHVGNCTYNEGEATFKVKLTKAGSISQEVKMLDQFASLYDIDPTRIAKINGASVTLRGYNSKASKMPWQVESIDGKDKYKLTDEQAKSLFCKMETVHG
tara:strand:- start:131 stop:529 length:399 start_codon:yes stop_codon:yes gene_type:complete